MKTFLLAWNPNNWEWTTLDEDVRALQATGSVLQKWSIASYKKIKPGDRVFLMRLGIEPKGIMGAGFVSTEPFLSEHWKIKDKQIYRVMVEFEVLLKDELLPLSSLYESPILSNYKRNWTPQTSGIEIPSDLVYDLEEIWFGFIENKILNVETRKTYYEGASNQTIITRYERNPFARNACLEVYGFSCCVCEFNFAETYGNVGKDFIHVHHLKQLSSVGETYKVDPILDLRPVCPNCHAIIHKRKEPYTIEEVKSMINRAR